MADINAELMGAQKPQHDARKSHKLASKEFKLRVEITDEQYKKAHFYEFTRRTFTQLIIILAVVLVAQAVISGSFTNPEVPLYTKAGVILVAALAFIGLPLFVKGRWRFMRDHNDFWVNDQRFTLNFKGLACISHHGDRRLAWREFNKIMETDEGILFVLTKFHMVVLPLDGFSDDEKQQIRDLIIRNTGAMRIKPKLKKTKNR